MKPLTGQGQMKGLTPWMQGLSQRSAKPHVLREGAVPKGETIQWQLVRAL